VSECIALAVLHTHTLIPLSSCPSPVLNPTQAAHRAGSPPACRSTRRLARAALSHQPASCRRHASHAPHARASRCIGAPDAHPTFSSHFPLLILPIFSLFLQGFFFSWSSFFVNGLPAVSALGGENWVVVAWYGVGTKHEYGIRTWIMDECMWACMETDMMSIRV
jgi:hypothetical protein